MYIIISRATIIKSGIAKKQIEEIKCNTNYILYILYFICSICNCICVNYQIICKQIVYSQFLKRRQENHREQKACGTNRKVQTDRLCYGLNCVPPQKCIC